MHTHQTEHVNAGIPPPHFVPEPSSDEEEVPPPRSAKDISRQMESKGLSQEGPKPGQRPPLQKR
eukprot:9769198-Ditylum_brightwellii.AAC.1